MTTGAARATQSWADHSFAYLCHSLRTPKLVNELVQGVDRQLPAQCSHLGEEALLQVLHPFQDTRTMQVPLLGTHGACRTEGPGGT